MNNDFQPNEETLFSLLADIAEPGERKVFLDQTCMSNPELRKRLEQLTSLKETADRFFDINPTDIFYERR
jgi:hypothetical protein